MRRRLFWLLLFLAAMSYMESAVVAYLRELYYPEGFRFPIVLIPDRLAAIEVGREAATILMLAAIGMIAGSDRWERFLLFCLGFGVWDLLYYAWLRVFIGWPGSLLDWDILFLIPVPWIAPVLAPVIVAVAMIAGAAWLMLLRSRGLEIRFPPWAWALAVAGGLAVVLSFTLDFEVALKGVEPPPFRWWLYGAGCGAGCAALVLGARRLRASDRA